MLACLLAQIALPALASRVGLSQPVALGVWLALMAALVVLALVNRDQPGMLVAALGIALNVVVIGFNGGMPVSERAVALVAPGRSAPEYDLLHRALDGETILPFLADVIPVFGPYPHRGVASIGDVLLSGGVGYFLFASMRRRGDAEG